MAAIAVLPIRDNVLNPSGKNLWMLLLTLMDGIDDLMASITCRGAVIVGKDLSIDGHEDNRLRVVTHAHSDHLIGITESGRNSPKIVAHPATFEIMDILGITIPREKIYKVSYGEKIDLGNGVVKTLRSKHILGSIQTLYLSENGVSVVYTGDFKEPGNGTEIPESDIVITEATYGSPDYVRPYKDIVEELLADLVAQLLSRGPLVIKAYYGKQQEVMEILRNHGVEAPFIANNKIYKISKIAEKYGLNIGDIFLEGTAEAEEITRQGWYIYFTHNTSRKPLANAHGYKHTILHLTGWEKSLYRAIDNNTYVFAFSGHSDFEELLTYVENAKPRLVIVDAYRGDKNAIKFSSYLEKKLGIRSRALPLPTLCY